MDLLHSGMSCSAEIIIDQYESAIYVPIQAVMNVAGKPTVYIVKGEKVKPRTVETGLDNNTVIRIASGLEPGDIVSLTPPLAQAAVVEKISDLSFAPAGGTSGSKVVNQNEADSVLPPTSAGNNQGSRQAEGDNASVSKDKNTDSGNRYSTTSSISDSGNSGGGPGGGMPGGGGNAD
jgi:HlyD family secretion protein